MLLAGNREQRPQLRGQPALPVLVLDLVQPAEQCLALGNDLLPAEAARLDVDRPEDEPFDVFAERDRQLDVSHAGAQVPATMSAGVSCSVSSRLNRAGSSQTNALQIR